MKKLIIATRGSKLALWQSNHIKDILKEQNPGLEIELNVIATKELEESILNGEAHIAVNSLKDVPIKIPKGLLLAAITEREDVRDTLLSQKYADIDSLPKGAVVGTSSPLRRMQMGKIRPDIKIKELSGNIDTRIEKLKNSEFDAIILAAAGINRLGLLDEVEHIYPISLYEMIPSMGQGALGIEAIDNDEVLKIVKGLEDDYSRVETTIERDFIDALDCGCHAPVGVNATVLENNDVIIKAVLGMLDGTSILSDSKLTSRENYESVGREMAQQFIDRGAKDILAHA
ncbi:hydroxymethylbilane synthase [Sulfurimonas sp.]|uniref:hydroxymethylbilane synthase n=1 Tax=Sulfurimonas sp. TaxID=2022749 RepID=UPI003569D542